MLLLHPHHQQLIFYHHPHHHHQYEWQNRLNNNYHHHHYIITYGNLSSHTNRQEKDKNCHEQYKIVEIVESGVAKVDHICKHFRQESSVPHAENSHCHCVSEAAVFGDQCVIKRRIKVKKDTSVAHVKSEA
ncbi:hypothetical protein ElyMa_004814300 [Elysia marginata]|uniref:Uncharacterized protein n=1 Tax=Elysia marginata TaxID=1093978 RepID=A0AAV4IEM9_9GAST|nr:hypothetical protein ElyMa_004814300 [Elysia marginata]